MRRQPVDSGSSWLGLLALFAVLGCATALAAANQRARSQDRGIGVRRGVAQTEWPSKTKRFALIIGVDQSYSASSIRCMSRLNLTMSGTSALRATSLP